MIALAAEVEPGVVFAYVAVGALFLYIYSYAAIGLAYIIGHSAITRGLRSAIYGEEPEDATGWNVTLRRVLIVLLECPACLGFWIGLAFGWWVSGEIPLVENETIVIFFALYTVGSNLLLGVRSNLMKL